MGQAQPEPLSSEPAGRGPIGPPRPPAGPRGRPSFWVDHDDPPPGDSKSTVTVGSTVTKRQTVRVRIAPRHGGVTVPVLLSASVHTGRKLESDRDSELPLLVNLRPRPGRGR
jgi:hypothetical protein